MLAQSDYSKERKLGSIITKFFIIIAWLAIIIAEKYLFLVLETLNINDNLKMNTIKRAS